MLSGNTDFSDVKLPPVVVSIDSTTLLNIAVVLLSVVVVGLVLFHFTIQK